jgi:hypothetical protein
VHDIEVIAVEDEAPTTDGPAAQSETHPAWCDLDECTRCDKGGAHHSTWMTLGPMPVTGFVARAYVYQDSDASAPAAMVSLHFPVDHPDDIAENAGRDEDTTGFVLPLDHVDQLNDFLTMVLAMSQGAPKPEEAASSPR